MRVEEHTTTVDDVPVFYRSAGPLADPMPAGADPTPAPAALPVYLHDAITSSADFAPFLEATGGLAPDLIGFGRSGKGGHLDYSPQGLTDFVASLLNELAVERVSLVGHGWGGAIALLLASREPARVERVTLIDAVPLLPGFSWHGVARLWRSPVIGELAMGAVPRRWLFRLLRQGATSPDAWSDQRLREVWEGFDQGTQRALLRLHRAADEPGLAELGAPLARLEAPALVIWGERDPWFAPAFADAYGALLPNATVEHLPDAGHWPWLDDPRVIERVGEFVSG